MGNADSLKKTHICPLSISHLAFVGAIQLAIILAFFDYSLAVIPIAIFIIIALIAPFFQGLSFYLPIVRKLKNRQAVALTFDDGPDPQTTPILLKLLAEKNVKATFFLVAEKAACNRNLVKMILDAGHEIGSHSLSHDTLIMLKGKKRLEKEITKAQEIFVTFGIRPVAFRPPVGITNPHLFRILIEHSMFCAGFSCKGGDIGNRKIDGLAKKIISRVKGGDIILLHDVSQNELDLEKWKLEVSEIIDEIRKKRLEIISMGNGLERPVMELEKCDSNLEKNSPISLFYDSIASDFDSEQESAGHSKLRDEERKQILSSIETIIKPNAEILEIGAGSGRFTIELAKYSKSVLANDISAGMLAVLDRKLAQEKITNVSSLQGDILAFNDDREFDCVCSFSAFEYVADIDEMFNKINSLLNKKGLLYFTTSHRSFYRFFTQIGNALRQGIWLEARSKKEISKALESAGFELVNLNTFGLKSAINRGMLIEVLAKKVRHL